MKLLEQMWHLCGRDWVSISATQAESIKTRLLLACPVTYVIVNVETGDRVVCTLAYRCHTDTCSEASRRLM